MHTTLWKNNWKLSTRCEYPTISLFTSAYRLFLYIYIYIYSATRRGVGPWTARRYSRELCPPDSQLVDLQCPNICSHFGSVRLQTPSLAGRPPGGISDRRAGPGWVTAGRGLPWRGSNACLLSSGRYPIILLVKFHIECTKNNVCGPAEL